ncbi:hypothetical protein D7V80_40845 [Corallococcus sp. CA054B]|uniref:Uncharacterized protein n=1 Tax=Corallococcus coralloides (strain ATCC 25202 / DSM 2259 / NBRC 100086 / M2) TaxID=1144275 RepID=H8MY14_CORCM|nr:MULTISPECIES: hypothetical protein [Corallococcus]AFE07858.1 hypothetical protein COCOR_07982 [Corallococcus coralloides DSM 2259]RKG56065.1 hypothetical protein D7V80_40845 [Corallococcus sp. CA054B]
MGGIGKIVSSVAKTVSNIAGGVANIAGKALNFVQNPVGALAGGLKGIAGGLLDKLPFGLGNLAKPFVDKFIDSGASMLSQGPLAGLNKLTQFAPTVKSIADIATTVKQGADKVGALASQPAQQNFQNLMAYGQAQLIN